MKKIHTYLVKSLFSGLKLFEFEAYSLNELKNKVFNLIKYREIKNNNFKGSKKIEVRSCLSNKLLMTLDIYLKEEENLKNVVFDNFFKKVVIEDLGEWKKDK